MAREIGSYRTVLNTDDVADGGCGVRVAESVTAEPIHWHGQPSSAAVTLPPLAILILEPGSLGADG